MLVDCSGFTSCFAWLLERAERAERGTEGKEAEGGREAELPRDN